MLSRAESNINEKMCFKKEGKVSKISPSVSCCIPLHLSQHCSVVWSFLQNDTVVRRDTPILSTLYFQRSVNLYEKIHITQ